SDGVKGRTAVAWGLVDEAAPRGRFAAVVAERARAAAARSPRDARDPGIRLTPLARTQTEDAITYPFVEARLDRGAPRVGITRRGRASPPPPDAAAVRAEGVDYWPLAVTRALDDLVLLLRCNELELGTWVLRSRGDAEAVMAYDRQLASLADDWFAIEVRGY